MAIVMKPARLWWLAATLSMVVPGLGQVYNGQLARGIVLCLLMIASAVVSLLWLLVRGAFYLWLALPLVLLLLIHIWIITDAMMVARRLPKSYQCRPCNRIAVYIVFSALVLGAFQLSQHLVVRIGFASYPIDTPNPDSSFEPGDLVLCNRLAYGLVDPEAPLTAQPTLWWRDPIPKEVVLYRSPGCQDKVLPGRFMACEGQRVELSPTALKIDGVPMAFTSDLLTAAQRGGREAFTVPRGHLCMLRSYLEDGSIRYQPEVVTRTSLVGKPLLIYWSRDIEKKRVRTERIGLPAF
jgi:signal peptidase I